MLSSLIEIKILNIESSQLRNVPWVALLLPCRGVLDAVCSSWDYLGDDVWPFPGGLEFQVTFLLQPQN